MQTISKTWWGFVWGQAATYEGENWKCVMIIKHSESLKTVKLINGMEDKTHALPRCPYRVSSHSVSSQDEIKYIR